MNTVQEYEKAKLFFNRQILTHVVKTDGRFLNGFIIEVQVDFFVIDDRMDGKQYVYFKELGRSIEPYKVRKVE